MGQYFLQVCRRRLVCNSAGVRARRPPGAWAVGRPTLHGGPVRLHPVKATPCYKKCAVPTRQMSFVSSFGVVLIEKKTLPSRTIEIKLTKAAAVRHDTRKLKPQIKIESNSFNNVVAYNIVVAVFD